MTAPTSYRTYWAIWGVLLALTVIMIFLEALRLPAALTILVLVVAMLVKAALIGGWFMHLRFERRALIVSVVAATLVTAAFLFFLLVPDGMAVLRDAPR